MGESKSSSRSKIPLDANPKMISLAYIMRTNVKCHLNKSVHARPQFSPIIFLDRKTP